MKILEIILQFIQDHPKSISVVIGLILVHFGLKTKTLLSVLRVIRDILGGIGEVTTSTSIIQSVVIEVANKTPLTLAQAADVIKVNDEGKVIVDKVAIAKQVIVSGDFKKAERKFRKWFKKI